MLLSIPSLMKTVACAAAVSEEADDELQQLLQSFSTGVDSADACEEPSQVSAVLCVANQSRTAKLSVTIALWCYVVSSTFVPGTYNVYESPPFCSSAVLNASCTPQNSITSL